MREAASWLLAACCLFAICIDIDFDREIINRSQCDAYVRRHKQLPGWTFGFLPAFNQCICIHFAILLALPDDWHTAKINALIHKILKLMVPCVRNTQPSTWTPNYYPGHTRLTTHPSIHPAIRWRSVFSHWVKATAVRSSSSPKEIRKITAETRSKNGIDRHVMAQLTQHIENRNL